MKRRDAIAIAAATSILVGGVVFAGEVAWTVGSGQIADGAVTTAKIATSAVTNAKLADSYSGVGACAAGRFASTLTVDAAPTCTQVGFVDLSGSLAIGQTPLTTRGDLLIATGVSPALGRLAVGGATVVLHGGTEPAYSAVSLTADVTGILGSANGGTGNGFAKFSGPTVSEKTFTLPDATTTILTTNALVTVGQGGTNLASYTTGDLLYASAATTIAGLADAAAGKWLRSGGAGLAPAWSTPTLPNSATTGTILRGDGTNWIASTPTYPNAATSGAILRGDGTNIVLSTPTWPNTAPASGVYPKGNGTNFVLSTGAASGTGACAANTWASTLTADAAPTCTVVPGAFIGTQVLTSGTVYTPTSGTKTVTLLLIGGGAGGGGVKGAVNSSGAAGGGGGGSTCTKTFGAVSGTYTIAIGAGGAGGSGVTPSDGSAGTSTTFANGVTTYTAPGGSGGVAMTSAGTLQAKAGGAGGAIATNCDVNGAGGPGQPGFTVTAALGNSGAGGSTPYGRGGVGVNSASVGGVAGIGFGAGGSGAISIGNSNQTGGAGVAGVIVVYEYR